MLIEYTYIYTGFDLVHLNWVDLDLGFDLQSHALISKCNSGLILCAFAVRI